MARSRVTGVAGVRKLLRRIPDAMRGELAESMQKVGRQLLAAMRADVPVKTGFLRRGLSMKFLPKSLSLKVGILNWKHKGRRFYARFVEFGRRGQVVSVRRRRGAGSLTVRGRKVDTFAPYQMRVRAMAARPFVYTRRTALRGAFRRELNGIWDRALAQASTGAGDD